MGAELKPGDPEFDELWKGARGGDEKAMRRLRPHLVRLEGGDGPSCFTGSMRAMMVRESVKDLLDQDALIRNADAVRSRLAGGSPTFVESLLADRCATNWLAVHLLELETANARDGVVKRHADRMLTQAHRRFMDSLKTLARVRQLAVPRLLAQAEETT